MDLPEILFSFTTEFDDVGDGIVRDTAPEDLPFTGTMLTIRLFLVPRVERILYIGPPEQGVMISTNLTP